MAETIGKGDGAATAAGDTKGEPPPNDSGKASDADAKEEAARAEEARKAAEAKKVMRQANLNPKRLDASETKGLDSSIKRNSALIRRLRQLSEDQREAILEELKVVNASKYVSEAVGAVCDAKLKAGDISAAVEVCSVLHQRYPDFAPALLPALVRVVLPTSDDDDSSSHGGGSSHGGSAATSAVPTATSAGAAGTIRRRGALRLLVELYLCGVFTDAAPIVTTVKELASIDANLLLASSLASRGEKERTEREKERAEKERETALASLTLLVAMARCSGPILGLKLEGGMEEEGAYGDLNVTDEQRRALMRYLASFLELMTSMLMADQKAMNRMARDIERALAKQGEVPEDQSSAYEKSRKALEQLLRNVNSLAEALEKEPVSLPEDEHTTHLTSAGPSATLLPGSQLQTTSTEQPLWDDDEMRAFYEDLPDLRAFVPAVLLGDSESGKEGGKDEGKDENEAEEGKAVESGQTADTAVEQAGSSEKEQASGPIAPAEQAAEKSPQKGSHPSDEPLSSNADVPSESAQQASEQSEKRVADEGSGAKGSRKAEQGVEGSQKERGGKSADSTGLDALLQRLPTCVSRDLIDQLTVDFCFINSKANRRRLVKALFAVPRNALQLLPYCSRLLATLHQCMKDVAPGLLQLLEDEFFALKAKKDQINIESRIRNVRFLGELAKFKVAPASLIFSCLKSLLEDFNHHNIDVACSLLETAGPFLARHPDTAARSSNVLDIVLRLKNARSFDPRQSHLIESAYSLCRPPERPARLVKIRPPLHDYIRKLVFSDLDQHTLEAVVRQLRKLPWQESEPYLVRCLLRVHRGRFSRIPLVAALVAALGKFHDSLSVAVVDQLVEGIRLGLEDPSSSNPQRRVAAMRLLGELYGYRVVDTALIFDTLYLLLYFGMNTPLYYMIDPPDDTSRIRLVCSLLSTCGHFFEKGPSRRKLDRFLLLFQHYVLSKPVIPMDTEFDLQELFAKLRPKMKRLATLQEAEERLAKLAATQGSGATAQAKQSAGLGEQQGGQESQQNGAGLAPVIEEGGEEQASDEEGEDGDKEEEDGQEEGQEGEGNEGEKGDRVGREERKVDPQEEEEFEKEFKALMSESLAERRLEKRGLGAAGFSVPMMVVEGSKESGLRSKGGRNVDAEAGGEDESVMAFRVLVKKGNKTQAKEMLVPKDSAMAVASRKKEEEEERERQEMKRRVLEYNEREGDDSASVPAAIVPRGRPTVRPSAGPGTLDEGLDALTGGRGGRKR